MGGAGTANKPESPGTKKKRRTSTNTSSPQLPDLVPPQPKAIHGQSPSHWQQQSAQFTNESPSQWQPPNQFNFGDTIIASNPFDDFGSCSMAPSAQQHMPQQQQQGMPPGMMQGGPGPHMNQMYNLMANPLSPGGMGMGMRPGMGTPPVGHPPAHMGNKPMPVPTGKMYPPDQSMVFNPQNPNAPPIYPCGICHKEVQDNDQAILCESGCNFWFHRICTGLTELAFQLLTAEVYAEWVCEKCRRSKSIPLVKFKP